MIFRARQQNRSRFGQNVLRGEAHFQLRLITEPISQSSGKVRIDVLRRFGYYSTESNGHLSEYLPWYRKRVDEIPSIFEANPTKAVLIEKIKDCDFSVLANAYSNQEMYAWAMECDKTQTGLKMVEKAKSFS